MDAAPTEDDKGFRASVAKLREFLPPKPVANSLFSHSRPTLAIAHAYEDLQRLLPTLDQIVPSQLPHSTRNQLIEKTSGVMAATSAIVDVTGKQQLGDQSVNALEAGFANSTRALEEFLPRAVALQVGTRLPGDVDEYRAKLATLLKEIEEKKVEAVRSADDAKQAALDTSVSKQAKHFDELSRRHRRASMLWLAAIAIVAALLVKLALDQFSSPLAVRPETKWMVIQQEAAKVVMLTLGSFMLIFCVRNYNASTHNRIVNEHRAKAMATFQSFMDGAADEKTKNAILEQSCKAVFDPHVTGYLKRDDKATGLVWLDALQAVLGKK